MHKRGGRAASASVAQHAGDGDARGRRPPARGRLVPWPPPTQNKSARTEAVAAAGKFGTARRPPNNFSRFLAPRRNFWRRLSTETRRLRVRRRQQLPPHQGGAHHQGRTLWRPP